jgi:type VI secretion system protein ImpF
MARVEDDGAVTQSVLDRLITLDLKSNMDPRLTRSQSVRQLKESLKRDLEWLLNTRRNPEGVPEGFQELERSVYNYGLPDISSLGLHSTKDRNRLLRLLEQTISALEPRLQDVRVSLEPVTDQTRILRFLIQGILRLEPAPEQVSFDTVLELSSGQYQVQGEHNAR